MIIRINDNMKNINTNTNSNDSMENANDNSNNNNNMKNVMLIIAKYNNRVII